MRGGWEGGRVGDVEPDRHCVWFRKPSEGQFPRFFFTSTSILTLVDQFYHSFF